MSRVTQWLESSWQRAASWNYLAGPTYWINGRAFCESCQFVGWVIKHPLAIVACPRCGRTTRPAVGDEAKPIWYGARKSG